jgi:hypothetical protein
MAELFHQGGSQFFDNRHLLKRQRALKKLPAVKAASQNEMSLQQGLGLSENI